MLLFQYRLQLSWFAIFNPLMSLVHNFNKIYIICILSFIKFNITNTTTTVSKLYKNKLSPEAHKEVVQSLANTSSSHQQAPSFYHENISQVSNSLEEYFQVLLSYAETPDATFHPKMMSLEKRETDLDTDWPKKQILTSDTYNS